MAGIDYENMKRFAYRLFAQMIDGENPVISPVSAYMTLAVAGSGAGGTTKDEFYSVLGKNMGLLAWDVKNRFSAQGDFMNVLLSNVAWIDDRFIINRAWQDSVKNLTDAEVFQAKLFQTETMDAVNQWIYDKTNGMIDRFLTEPFHELVMLVLFNTVYFKGSWAYPFDEYCTNKEQFYLKSNRRISQFLPQTTQVDMMNKKGDQFAYIANHFAEGVILPYHTNKKFEYDATSEYDEGIQELIWDRRGNLAFVAIKSKGDIGIREVCRRLDGKTMKELIKNRKNEMIDLKLPRFEAVFDKVLNESLINMGLTKCFDRDTADFSSIGKSPRGDTLYIEQVRQKVKITINEQGTEAAAVDKMFGALGIVEERKKLYFNEPFLYLIMDIETQMPLFIGILDCPMG